MLQRDLSIDPRKERQQLLVVGLGLPAVAALLHLWRGAVVMPSVLAGVGALALLGTLFYRWIGRDVFLGFSLFAMAVGGVVSRLVVAGLYLTTIALFGSLLRIFGVDRLRKDFGRNRKLESMLVPVPPAPADSPWRQS